MTKREDLSTLPPDYLLKLARHLNQRKRSYSNLSHDDLLTRVSRKLTVDDVELVLEEYEDGTEPYEVAEKITPAPPREIRKAVEDYFDKQGVYEVKIGGRWCDIVFPDELIAVEIKSARDRVDDAVDQVNYYKQWADEVYLAYDEEHSENVPEEIRKNGVGQLEFQEGSIERVKDAKQGTVDPESRLEWMTYRALTGYARNNNIRVNGGKENIAKHLASHISKSDSRDIFQDYLESR